MWFTVYKASAMVDNITHSSNNLLKTEITTKRADVNL